MLRGAVLSALTLAAAVLVAPAAAVASTGAPPTPPPTTAAPPPSSGAVAPMATICDKYCDARDPALATQDRQGVTATAAGNRQLSLHLDDADDMGWGAITNSSTGDELWLDRSFDAGRSWASGSKLGDTKTPSGYPGWRTLMFNDDDWNNNGVGLLRACAQPAGSTAITCTDWRRTTWNSYDRRTAAATALMEDYDNGTGLFGTTGWWNSANALTAIIGNIRASGMGSYTYAIANTYTKNLSAQGGNFTNAYNDDTLWWGLAWVAAYDQTGDSRYLSTARFDADHVHSYWDGTCGGGVWWSSAKTYKNAIPNSLYIQLNAALHNRISGDTTYLQRARAGWAWFRNSGMINGQNLVNDGLTSTCVNNNQPTWTYNQGVPLAALAELYRATGNGSYLDQARTLANASTTSTALNPNGILRDPGEQPGGVGDGPTFKGVYARDLSALNAALSDHPYTAYLKRQADSAYTNDRNGFDQYGLVWSGPFDQSDAARQQSALDLLNATG
ncbi:glycoside hydrolase family 76 protein [Kutzneria kofuensis]|uniref:Putative alpha-1,6-mannanase (GH76 family) n=1 Tax=Kutzneria kofuensis TaxID=103725 RepID=A0A7W9KQB1_9PSEU|nr:glycoside hydrolase family 76 protein [Kutzneria kofuensis]MBB5896463.1 putative alpha-1,6-mannanase (GH76 family) [Kutzneria kofuensis]